MIRRYQQYICASGPWYFKEEITGILRSIAPQRTGLG
jgi:hypothetical protein